MKFLHKLDSFVERDEIFINNHAPIVAFSCELGKFFRTDEMCTIPDWGTFLKWKRPSDTDFFLIIFGREPIIGDIATDATEYPEKEPTEYEITEVFPDENKAYKKPWVSLTKDQVQTQITDGSGNVYTYVGDGVFYGTWGQGIPSPID